MSGVRIGLAGAGYWGSKLARNIFESSGGELAYVCDPDRDRVDAVRARYPGTEGVTELEQLLASDVDAVVLATPAVSHFEHARAALEAGKHAMVEKPLAMHAAQCRELTDLADSNGLTLMVGHTFAYSEPVRVLRSMIVHGELGQMLYLYSQRVNLGVIRSDLNALWNFGPHDVSILLYLIGSPPLRVSARQFSILDRGLEDVAFVTLEFADDIVAHVHLSWLDPRKVRLFTVVGSEKMVVYDDTDTEGPLKVYDKNVLTVDKPAEDASFEPTEQQGFGEFKFLVRSGDLLVPRIEAREPLRVEIDHFLHCVKSGNRPLTDGVHATQVVATLEAAQQSADQGGALVNLPATVSA